MVENRNGYWMSPKWYAQFAPDSGGGNGGDAGAGGDGTGDTGDAGDGGDGAGDGAGNDDPADDSAAKIARLEAQIANQKKAIDKATKEAAQYKRDLRAKQSAEEIAAEEKKAADEAAAKEIEELRKEVARTKAVKTVMSRLNLEEESASTLAECLYGAEDIDGALTELQRVWTAREKALRMEFSKIPAPSAGSSDGPTITKEQLSGMGYKERLDFANKHPDEYNKLMGRQ